jgi:hypothetical protein
LLAAVAHAAWEPWQELVAPPPPGEAPPTLHEHPYCAGILPQAASLLAADAHAALEPWQELDAPPPDEAKLDVPATSSAHSTAPKVRMMWVIEAAFVSSPISHGTDDDDEKRSYA